MFEESIDYLWVAAAIGVLVVGIVLAYLIYQMALVVKESRKTVEDVNRKLIKADPVVDAVVRTANDASESVTLVKKNVVEPVTNLGGMVKGAMKGSNMIKKFMNK